MNRRSVVCLALIILMLSGSQIAKAQSGVGFPFLKIGAGARQSGMGGVFTGVGDDINTIYWNPGGLGHLRRWQWAATYNRWFSDIYQGQFAYAKQFRIFGSHKTTFAGAINYLGMPDWDATGGLHQAVSAGHVVASISAGQRLDWLSDIVSIGVTFKSIYSNFDQLSSKGLATDFGLLVRPHRFKFKNDGLFKYGVFTFGLAYLNLGSDVTVVNETSSLPATLRAGMSLNMGRYDGFSLLLATDAVSVKNRDLTFGLGTELWWRQALGVRIGYRFNGPDLGNFTAGFGFRWNDALNKLIGLPTRNFDAFELDIASSGYGDVLQETYRGTVTHYPLAPEPFHFYNPQVVTSQVLGGSSDVNLTWEEAYDPDPFDEVKYLVLIGRDKLQIRRAIKFLERDMLGFLASSLKDSLHTCKSTPETFYNTDAKDRGIYHWAVAAYDLGWHARQAKLGQVGEIGQFVIETADILVQKVEFDYSKWITITPEQGKLKFVVANEGNGPALDFRFVAFDHYQTIVRPLIDIKIAELSAETDTTIWIDWSTELNGLHKISTRVDPDSSLLELKRDNNYREDEFFSIPKGRVILADTVEVTISSYDSAEINVVPEVYFEENSALVDSSFFVESIPIPGILFTIAKRMKSHPGIDLNIMGSICDLSGEKQIDLALQRANSVRDALINLGLDQRRLKVVEKHDDVIIKDRQRSNEQDNNWHKQQNRRVGFSVDLQDEYSIFRPNSVAVDTTIQNVIPIKLQVLSPARIETWLLRDRRAVELSPAGIAQDDSLTGVFNWDGTDKNDKTVSINSWLDLTLQLEDTTGRHFYTRPDSMFIKEKNTIRRLEMFGAAKFAKTEPVYQFYWDKLMDMADELAANPDMTLQFEGHACATGPEALNKRLSTNRARAINQAFLERLQKKYPDQYASIRKRVLRPLGLGESTPLTLKMQRRKEILLGDNQSPVGRYLNRRIMVRLIKNN